MKTKYFLLGIVCFLSFTSTSIFYSCSEEENVENNSEISEADVAKLLNEKYNISKSDLNSIDFNKLKIEQKNLDVSCAELYTLDYSGEVFLIIPEIMNSNNFTLLKFIEVKGEYIVEKELILQFGLDCEGNGDIRVTNKSNGEKFNTIFLNGKPINYVSSNYLDTNSATTKGLCQREGSETFKECFDRESDAFCDDFIGTVAYYTHPGIPVLIAALCTC